MTEVKSTIQNKIISRLKNASSLKYSELQPKNIPNDLFNYHLQFLVKKGLINKDGSRYSLSKSGIKYVADVTKDTNISGEILFKVNPVMILCRKEKGKIQVLNQLRKSQPSYGKKGGARRRGQKRGNA
jgi:hypothetical protein